MAKTGKFAALAEFRQHPDPEPELETVEAPPVPDVVDAPAPTEPEAIEAPVQPEPEPDELLIDLDDDSIDEVEEVEEAKPARPRQRVVVPARPRGRPPGKRSDPDWKLYSHFLKRSTQRQATSILFDADDGRDLSDVLQSLLEKWVARRRAKS